MKVNEFIEEVNKVAYAEYNQDEKEILIYKSKELVEPEQWAISLVTDWAALKTDDPTSTDLKLLLDIEPYIVARIFELIKLLMSTPISERFAEKKYTVQVIEGDENSYLNKSESKKSYFVADDAQIHGTQTHFTQSEINELKQREDVAIDWNKAVIEEVEDDED